MKKIFIGDSIVFLVNEKMVAKLLTSGTISDPYTISPFENRRILSRHIEEIELLHQTATYIITASPVKEMENSFFSLYKKITAAGGVVFNEQGRILMIFRKGKWDLPKGKLDRGESIREAAKREVMEETSIENLTVQSKIRLLNGRQDCTYHTYFLNGKRTLKSTYWFRMKSSDKKKLIPQAMEGIEIVEWCSAEKVKEHLKNSYRSIADVLNEVMPAP